MLVEFRVLTSQICNSFKRLFTLSLEDISYFYLLPFKTQLNVSFLSNVLIMKILFFYFIETHYKMQTKDALGLESTVSHS
jgi:hypothetical protein